MAANSWRPPSTASSIPTTAPAASLSSEPHSFSRVFTGAFFEGLAGMLATTDTKNDITDSGTFARRRWLRDP